ncbi:hypothetical protein ES708_26735 [subsurface metagenome]
MHTTIAWAEANTPDDTFQKLTGVADQHVKRSEEKFYLFDYNHLIGAAAFPGALALEARLVSPSLRRINPFYITPIEAALVPTEPLAMIYHPMSPIRLDVNESLEAELKATAGVAREASIVAFLSPGASPPVNGEIFTINCEVYVELILHKWQYAEITFPDSLPVGNYRVVGVRAVIADGVAFRLVPVGEAYRPGGLCAQAVNENDPPLQRFGGLGNWCSFSTIQPPGMEVLCSTAAGVDTYQVYIDAIKA